MKVKKISVAIVTVSMVMISCDKNETMVQNYDGSVRFISGATAPASRVTIDTDDNSVWDKGDPIGIFMVEHESTEVVNAVANMKYTADNAGISTTFTPSGATIYYPPGESAKVDFIAYHPYRTAVSDFAYSINLSAQTSQTNIDLMTAKADKSGTGYSKEDGRDNVAVNFAFTHRLVKLVMNVTKDASVADNITKVSINGMNTTATFDLRGIAGITSPGMPQSITPYTAAENKYEAILLPVGSLTDMHVVKFETSSGETYKWSMKKEISSLEAGKIYTYDITVTKHAVTADGTINKWEVGETGTGNAE